MVSDKNTVIDILSNLANDKQFSNIHIGLFGSYARNEQTNNSDIDLVLKSAEPLLLVYDGIEDTLQTYIKANLGLECDIVDYADLEADYEEAKVLGVEEFTLKPVIDREAIWIDK
jgi:predicted nucleotidyltransferase